MKKLLFILFIINSNLEICSSQLSLHQNDLNLFKYIRRENVDYISYSEKINSTEYRSIIPYYEFSVSKIKIGDACLFAISRTYPESWVEQAIKSPKADCNKKGEYKESFYIRCMASRLLTLDTTTLKRDFDIYLLFIDKSYLEKPFIEEAEGGVSENYTPKKGCPIIIYMLSDSKWKEVDRIVQTNDDILKAIGSKMLKKIAHKKFITY